MIFSRPKAQQVFFTSLCVYVPVFFCLSLASVYIVFSGAADWATTILCVRIKYQKVNAISFIGVTFKRRLNSFGGRQVDLGLAVVTCESYGDI